MIKQLRLYLLLLSGILFADVESWNSTTFEYLWNKYAFNTKFREPIDVTPFEVRVSQLSYIGPQTKLNYFLPLRWMEINESDSSSISTKIKNIPSVKGLINFKNRV